MKSIITLLLAVFLLSAITANSYPISPRPLRKLIIESQYIIIGHVREIKKKPVDAKSNKKKEISFDDNTIAVIDVIEQLKGEKKMTQVDVQYSPNLICPAPPHYEAGTDVLVFLSEAKGEFWTHALSYGAKTLPMNELLVYKDRINEMLDIITIQDKDTQFMESIEWLVKCAEQSATSWEGTYELSRASDFMSFYDRTEGEPFAQLLSESQRERLKNGLFASTDVLNMGLVDLVYPQHEEEVFNLLLASLKKLPKEYSWMADGYMTRLLLHKHSEKLEKIYKDFDDTLYDDEDKKIALVAEFVQEIEK